jgi:hypothetical protein
MRLVNVLVTGTLFAAVLAEGAYIIRTHKQLETLSAQVQQLSAEAADEPLPRDLPRSAGSWVGARPTGGALPTAAHLPPPRFTSSAAADPAGSPASLPPGLDTPEARQQLRQFVALELEHQRDQWRDQQQQARQEQMQRRLETAMKTLGLTPDETLRLGQVMAKSDDARRDLRERIQSGQIPRTEIPAQMTALRQQTDKQIQEVIGDEKAQKFQDLTRQDRRPGGGFPGGGPGAGGGFFGGPGQGRAGAPSGTPPAAQPNP